MSTVRRRPELTTRRARPRRGTGHGSADIDSETPPDQLRYPDQDAVIIILTNTEGTKVRGMKDAIAERLLGSGK